MLNLPKPDVSDPMSKVTLTKFRSLSFNYFTGISLSYNRDWNFNTSCTRYFFFPFSYSISYNDIPQVNLSLLSTLLTITCKLLSLNSPIQLSPRAAFHRRKQTHSSVFSYSISCVLMTVHNRFYCFSTIPMQSFGKLHPPSSTFTRKTLSTCF